MTPLEGRPLPRFVSARTLAQLTRQPLIDVLALVVADRDPRGRRLYRGRNNVRVWPAPNVLEWAQARYAPGSAELRNITRHITGRNPS